MTLNINSVTIGGNLVRDIQLKTIGQGEVAEFTVAVNRRWKSKDGTVQERTAFVSVCAWGAQAKACAGHLAKGSLVLVEGELVQETWEKDGQKREKTKVMASHVHFIGPKREAQPAPVVKPDSAPEEDIWA